ncbi:MAG: hypothetical protein M1825_000146 [Sarcosagium campestre]|nr:MAG: hypothetical protein M1825_000146 [Sarcosagium campestre]
MVKVKNLFSKLSAGSAGQTRNVSPPAEAASVEGTAAGGVKAFCEHSTSPNSTQGEEVLHLPVIVDACESSPQAAKDAAVQIRKFLSKDNYARAPVQYNAIILIRILTDNPGHTFTRNFDAKFVGTFKELLRLSRDPSVQQIARETLDAFEREKKADEGLTLLLEMWAKEKGKSSSATYSATRPPYGGNSRHSSNYAAHPGQSSSRSRRPRALPPPEELAARVEEGKSSAKILLQLLQSTPATEVPETGLVKEFADRCSAASRSMQDFINSENPAPDEDTLLTLIETNDQLSLAMSKYQRAVLQTRKARASQVPSPSANPAQAYPPQGQTQLAQGGQGPRDPFADDNEAAPSNLQAPLRPGDVQDGKGAAPQSYPDDAGGPLRAQEPWYSGPAAPPPRRHSAVSDDLYDTAVTQSQQRGPAASSDQPQLSYPSDATSAPPNRPAAATVPTATYVQRQESGAVHTTMRGATDEAPSQGAYHSSQQETGQPAQYRY